MLAKIKDIAARLKREILALYFVGRDPRTPCHVKILIGLVVAYALSPIDLIPDFIPFLGEVDDLYLLLFALQRLISNAGRSVLLAHWSGAAEDLADLNLRSAISAAAFFLPRRIRRRLRVIGRG
jgi:uncharacterized membrane protein YkvA (DUF1232 family)